MTSSTPDEPISLELLANAANTKLADAPAEEIVRWAVQATAGEICVTSSMLDALIIDIASRVKPGIDVIFLDTGYHFTETTDTRDAIAAIYPVNMINVTPSRTVVEQDRDLGPRLYSRDPDLCCYLRKVAPLDGVLASYRGWITGVRREETVFRRDAQAIEWDPHRNIIKVNPIVGWSKYEVDAYIEANGVLVNPLAANGYPSIGCATCTLPVQAGADPRSGRWAGKAKTECGLHAPWPSIQAERTSWTGKLQ